ncbi:MAG TPA: MFS transporter [Casimicrobiaceae bacterium]|nr:MFS transporter [Casimicrobiaceae bacterium]
MRLRPDPIVTPEDLERGKRALVRDAAWATLAGALYGGVILVGFAVQLGASATLIGALAAIPFLAQLSQVGAMALVERARQRRRITVLAVSISRTLILGLALIPFLGEKTLQLSLLLAAQIAITLFGAIAGCSFNSWVHQLVPREALGALFSRRLFWSTVLSSLGALSAGYLVQRWPGTDKIHAYSIAFAAAGVSGFISSYYLTRVPEPAMEASAARAPILELLRTPFLDRDFRAVILFMASWNLASNLAAPFITVYLLRQMGYELGTVTMLWMVGQVATALTMYLWGRLSDRLTNKAILSVALPAYFAGLIGLAFTAFPRLHALTLPLLYLVHIVMGTASGGIGLATGNLGLKLAPQGRGTAYLTAVSLSGSIAAGIAALAGGVLADFFAARQLSLTFQWATPGAVEQVTVLQFRHWEFLFAISFALGFYVLHRLSRIREGEEHSERTVVQQFVIEAVRSLDQLSSIEGLRTVMLFPLGLLRERRLKSRPPP